MSEPNDHWQKLARLARQAPKTAETGAPFGFANTFLAMFGELKPTHVIVTLDRAGPTFRHEITETYKATRVPMADEEREESRAYLSALWQGYQDAVQAARGRRCR